MEIAIALIAVAVLGLAALVAVGRFGQMQAEPVRDTYQPPVPEGALRANDLAGIRFGITPMGYDMEQVDELMARLARELDSRDSVHTPAEPPILEQPPSAPGEDEVTASSGGEGSHRLGWRPSVGPHTE